MKIRDLVFEAPIPSPNTKTNSPNNADPTTDPNKKLDPTQQKLAKDTMANALGVKTQQPGQTPQNQIGQPATDSEKDAVMKGLQYMQGNLMNLPGYDTKQKIDKIDSKGVHFMDPQSGKQTVMDKDTIGQAVTPQQVAAAATKDKVELQKNLNQLKMLDPSLNTQKDTMSLMKSPQQRNNVDQANVGQLAGTVKPAMTDKLGVQGLKNLLMRMQHQTSK